MLDPAIRAPATDHQNFGTICVTLPNGDMPPPRCARVTGTTTGRDDRAHRDPPSQRYFEKHYDNPITSARVIAGVTPDRQRSAHL